MSSEQNKVILRAEHISKTYGEKKVLEDISIHLEQGELVSLLGVSGSGKTTLFNVLSGIIPPDEGKVYLLSLIHIYHIENQLIIFFFILVPEDKV